MAFRERTVTGTVVDADGTPVTNGKVSFKPTKPIAYTSSHVIVDRAFNATTDTEGLFSVTLWADDDSLLPVDYAVTFPTANNGESDAAHTATISLSYEDGSAKEIGTLIAESADPADVVAGEASLSALMDERIDAADADPTVLWRLFEDFDGANSSHPNFNFLAAGTSAAWSQFNVFDATYGTDALRAHVMEDAWGVHQARLGTSVTGRVDLVGKHPQLYGLALGRGFGYRFATRVSFGDLPTAANRYVFFAGFFDGDTTDPAYDRGVLFKYRDDENGGKIQAVTRSAAGAFETVVDTGITPVVNTWYRLRIEVNAAGTEAKFYIDGNLVATITTNIATGHLNYYTCEINNDRVTTDGTTNPMAARVDYYLLEMTGTASRL
jgi:hypothetical protein